MKGKPMATSRKKPKSEQLSTPAAAAPDPESPNPEPCPEHLYDQALHELDITVPVYFCRLVGNRLEFHLYGGRIIFWPPDSPSPQRGEGPGERG
jgi:hypothetical protein